MTPKPDTGGVEREMKRYTPGGEWWDQMTEADHGAWVRYDDALDALARRDEQLATESKALGVAEAHAERLYEQLAEAQGEIEAKIKWGEAWKRQAQKLLVRAEAAESESASLRAENERLRGAMLAQDDRERQAGEQCGISRAVYGCDWPDAVADMVLTLRARVTELEGALQAVTEHMDRAGGDGYGMPECPWCKAGPHGDDHRSNCELAAARDLLSPAPKQEDR